ncbi:hypothetical protein [Cupriavidus alkaliphilus]|uniref:hypothetical protein n=1 Tax=Cupriavidus alkaliphilus TaxID=942866 RepID=UPI00339D8D03
MLLFAAASCFFVVMIFIGLGARTAFFSPLRGRVRFNRKTRQVYVSRPGYCGGDKVFAWDRLEAVLKPFPARMEPKVVRYKQAQPHRAGVAKVTESKLLRLKGVAARYVAAGAVVVVIWDAVDSAVAKKEGNSGLAAANFGRALFGVASVAWTMFGAGCSRAPIWLARVNIITAIVSVALAVVINNLKGKGLDKLAECATISIFE